MAIQKSSKAVRKWLKGRDWHFNERSFDDRVVFTTGIMADSLLFKGYDICIVCRERDVQSTFSVPVTATPKKYASVAEYLMRVNDRFRRGKWTLDYVDGEICFNIVKDSEAVEADTDGAMDDLVGFATCVCDGYAEGIVQVIAGAKTPKQAYVEADARDNGADASLDIDGPEDAAAGIGVASSKKKGRGHVKHTEDDAKVERKHHSRKGRASTNALPGCYSLEGLNVEGTMALTDVIAAIRRFCDESCKGVDAPRMNILLSGAPGTGKTAFAHHIAKEVGMKLVVVKASDILGSHVGETEKQIDKVFADAKKQGAILLLDEIDGILGNRRCAEHTWEIRQTNQLLQCMESFGGVIIAATNLAENLDEAVMRRFTYKLKLSYLTDAGKTLFFKRYFNTPLTDEQQKRLTAIERLTPGDFRTVKEGLYYLTDKQNNDARLDALTAEAAAKRGPRRIGF